MGQLDQVIDDPSEGRFKLIVDGHVGELVYRVNRGRLVLIHTGVPEAIGRKGIGGQLVRAAVARAQRDSLVIVPLCPFARRWLEGHPDEIGSAVVDWGATH